MPNNWIKERGTGVYKRYLTRSHDTAKYLARGLKLVPDLRYPTPYYKLPAGSIVIRHVNGNEYEVQVNDATMRATVDNQITELLKAMPLPDNLK